MLWSSNLNPSCASFQSQPKSSNKQTNPTCKTTQNNYQPLTLSVTNQLRLCPNPLLARSLACSLGLVCPMRVTAWNHSSSESSPEPSSSNSWAFVLFDFLVLVLMGCGMVFNMFDWSFGAFAYFSCAFCLPFWLWCLLGGFFPFRGCLVMPARLISSNHAIPSRFSMFFIWLF